MTAEWVGLHAFCGREQDDLLLDCIAAPLHALAEEGLLRRWFYLRYANGGPHLRLRLECLEWPRLMQQRMRAAIEGHFADVPPVPVDAGAPSWMREVERRLGGDSIGAIEPAEPISPAGSVQPRRYVFDRDRYGGGAAREDALDHFCVSSELALAVLAHSRGVPRRRQTFACAAALALAAEGPTPKGAWGALFAEAADWGPATLAAAGLAPSPVQGEPLLELEPVLTGGRPRWPAPWDDLWQLWRDEVRRRRAALTDGEAARLSPAPVEHLLLDGMHLLCNRLGLPLAEECCVYALVAALLDEQRERSGRPAESGAR